MGGADDETLQELHLVRDPEKYSYLCPSGGEVPKIQSGDIEKYGAIVKAIKAYNNTFIMWSLVELLLIFYMKYFPFTKSISNLAF